MRIHFQQTGGFMGRKTELTLDLAALPPDQAEVLRQRVDDANFLTLGDSIPAFHPARDAFHYLITVETETLQHTIHVTDVTMPATLRPLIEELSHLAKLKNSR